MKLEFPQQRFKKSSNIKFQENPSSGSPVVPCGQTDRHDETNSCFCNFVTVPKNSTYLLNTTTQWRFV
jgi:hypothetical protein